MAFHAVDRKDALDHTTIKNGKFVVDSQYDFTRYDREDRAFETGQFVLYANKIEDLHSPNQLYSPGWDEVDEKTPEVQWFIQRMLVIRDGYKWGKIGTEYYGDPEGAETVSQEHNKGVKRKTK